MVYLHFQPSELPLQHAENPTSRQEQQLIWQKHPQKPLALAPEKQDTILRKYARRKNRNPFQKRTKKCRFLYALRSSRRAGIFFAVLGLCDSAYDNKSVLYSRHGPADGDHLVFLLELQVRYYSGQGT